jgi:hypothetical protein
MKSHYLIIRLQRHGGRKGWRYAWKNILGLHWIEIWKDLRKSAD